MLVLSRKMGEAVVIDSAGIPVAVVRVLRVERGRVKLGFEAPPDININREEVCVHSPTGKTGAWLKYTT